MKRSYRYIKKKYKKTFEKSFCTVCDEGFRIWKYTPKHNPHSTLLKDKLYEGRCVGGHEMCYGCIAGWYGDAACDEHNHLI